MASPFLTPLYSERTTQSPRTRSTDRPLMTVPSSKSPAAVTSPIFWPFIDDYQGPAPLIEEPIGAVTGKDRFALVVPELWPWGLDVRYRMIQPRELKQAQGFPEDYEIAGTKTQRTKQIGNAVPVNLARNLVKHVLTLQEPSLGSFGGGISEEPDVEIPEYHDVVAADGGVAGDD
ncbi:MAG: DNA cytosine methyltransferase [Halanaeroarchaeum sp.]